MSYNPIDELSCEDKLDIAIEALEAISYALDSWDHEEALHHAVDIAHRALMEIS